MSYIQQGTAAFRKTNLALFAVGFTTFANLYCIQPLLPELAVEFHVSPTAASLAMSLTTMALAIGMLLIGSLSEVWGRKPIMTFSMIAVSVLAVLMAFVPNFHALLASRILLGIVFAGLPSIAMAYLGEEIEPASLGVAMGLYISGTSIGGLSGRVISGVLTDLFHWRAAIAGIGMISVAAGLLFWLTLPSSRNFQPRTLEWGKLAKSLISHLKDPGLLSLYGISFLLMGSFVALSNYLGFQLVAPPYSLSQTFIGSIFIVYLVGTFSSTWMGRLADLYDRRKVLGISILIMILGALITLSTALLVKMIGLAVFTFGFFAGHSIASSWVGRLASHDKAQASSLYLFFYYVGSSVAGTAGGIFWTLFGWGGVISLVGCFLTLALIVSTFLPLTARSISHEVYQMTIKQRHI